MTNDENYNLPVNVKQIGTISDNSARIYVEDYVQTYIDQYASADVTKEKIAILVGKKIKSDDEEVIFISGVIQGKYTIRKNNMLELTDKSWQYVKKQLAQYFKNLNIIGWVYIQPGFEEYIGENVCSFQKDNQGKGLEVLYITDPSENVNSFYKWNSENQMFNQIKGYIIYYEKNEGMHEYMLENKVKQTRKEVESKRALNDAGAAARVVAGTKRNKYRKSANMYQENKKMINLLGGVSFVMLMVCFVMGAGLIQNDRINNLEEKISFLESGFEESQSVFAGQVFTEATTAAPTVTTEEETQVAVETELPTQAMQTAANSEYVVKEGDTLIKICKDRYGDTANLQKIKELNGLNGNTIVVGKKLLLP